MKVLITGSTGLIGHELCNIFKGQATTFITIGQSAESDINIDLSSNWDSSVLPTDVDCIFHLAQSNNFRDFPNQALDVFNVNTYSTLKLLDYAQRIGCKKFIYASTGGIYGNGIERFTEEHEIVFHSDLGFYQTSKLTAEMLVENYSSFFQTIILRFFFVHGPRQKKSMLIPRLIQNVKDGTPITLQQSEGLRINPIHVKDAAMALANCLTLDGNHKINIAGNKVMSLRGITSIMGDLLGKEPVYNIEEKMPGSLLADNEKMRKLLHEPQVDFSEGIKEMIMD